METKANVASPPNEHGNQLIIKHCFIDSAARHRPGINGGINRKGGAALHFPPIPSYSLPLPGARQ
jgi:hypothetical protein